VYTTRVSLLRIQYFSSLYNQYLFYFLSNVNQDGKCHFFQSSERESRRIDSDDRTPVPLSQYFFREKFPAMLARSIACKQAWDPQQQGKSPGASIIPSTTSRESRNYNENVRRAKSRRARESFMSLIFRTPKVRQVELLLPLADTLIQSVLAKYFRHLKKKFF